MTDEGIRDARFERVGFGNRLRRLERLAQGGLVSIPQEVGAVARSPASDLEAAFVNLTERMGAGEDAPPEHSLLAAARNYDDSGWSEPLFAAPGHGEPIGPVEDLSE